MKTFEDVQLREWRSKQTGLVAGVFAFLAISGLFIYFGPFSTATQITVLVHTGIGLLFVVPYVVYQVHHWSTNRERPFNHHKLLGYLSLGALAAIVVSGLVLTAQAGWGRRISYGWDQVHLLTGLAATALVTWHIAVIMGRHLRQQESDKVVLMRTAQAIFARRTGISVVALVVATTMWAALSPTLELETTLPADYQLPYGDSPFAPSLATTTSGEALIAEPMANSEGCGARGCHTEIVEEWLPSAHRYSSMSPFFQGVQGALAANNGPEATRYCGGCHDPIALFSGLKNLANDDLSGIGRHEGISCVSCHAIESTDVRGNANYTVAAPPRYLHELSDAPTAAWLGRFLIRAYPRQHVASFTRSLYKTPEFCAACHKQFIDEEVNNVGWIQLQNQYDTWRQSRWHTPDDPTQTVTCRECHMRLVDSLDPARGDSDDYNRSPDDGKHRSHRFLAANQYLPLLLDLPGAEEHVALTEQWLRGEIEIPEIADKWSQGPAVPIEILAPEVVRPGETIDFQVVTINNKPGHGFPTGPLDIIQAWIHVVVRDATGATVFESGALDDNHYLGQEAAVFKSEAVDKDGALIDRHNLWEMVGARFKRTLFPGHSDVSTYSFVWPADASISGPLSVEARLRYRKVNQDLIRFLLADSDLTARVTDIAEARATIRVEAEDGSDK